MGRGLVAGMVRVAVQDRECPVNLLQQDDAGQFVDERHFAEGERGGGGFVGFVGKAVGGANGQDKGLGVAILMILEKLGEFLGRELLSPGVEENDGVGGARAALVAEFEEGCLVWEGEGFDVGVEGDSLEVVVGEGSDGGGFRFADPGYF